MHKLIIIILTLLLSTSCSNNLSKDDLLKKLDSLETSNDSLVELFDIEKAKSNYWYNEKYDGESLIKIGIDNPKVFIEQSLRERTELIPIEAALGGTMHFGNVELLSREWLIAEFDDGHVYGRGIYKYTLNNKGELKFELLQYSGID